MNHSCRTTHARVALTSSTVPSRSHSALGWEGGCCPPASSLALGLQQPGPWASLLAALPASGSTAVPEGAGEKRAERGHCRSRKKATEEKGLVPPHSRSLLSGGQLCSLHPTNLAARFALCLGRAGVLWGRQLRSAASARGAGPAQGISHPFPLPERRSAPHLMSWHSQTVAKVPQPSLRRDWYRVLNSCPSRTGWWPPAGTIARRRCRHL